MVGTMIMPAGSFRNTTEGALFPTWTCIIDGVSNAPAPFIFPANRWPLCENDFLQDGQHNITLQIQVPEGQQFWFDYMQYKPSDTVPRDNADIYVSVLNFMVIVVILALVVVGIGSIIRGL